MSKENYFKDLAKIDVGEYTEKKGKFTYLSWAWAVDQLKRHDPNATWDVVRHEGMPYLKTECGFFVEVAVTCDGVTQSEIHPVLDNRNSPVAKPNAFDINTSIKRCLVKAIALHGLGLYIYAGEDLPIVPEELVDNEDAEAIRVKVQEFATLRGATKKKVYETLKINDVEGLSAEKAIQVLETLGSWIKMANKELAGKDGRKPAEPEKAAQ